MPTSTGKETLFKIVGIVAGIAIIVSYRSCRSGTPPPVRAQAVVPMTGLAAIMDAVAQHRSGVTVQHAAQVSRALVDAEGAERLQRFILKLENGHMILVAHDIDVAPRVPLVEGDRVEFRGRFDWNDVGGLISRTHHDPQMQLDDGWLRHNGKVYR